MNIYRDPVSGEGGNWIYIGDAVLVEGARPDIEAAFPGYPNNSRAGWGYMMLTNFLPNSGNGTFTFYAVVTDSGGHEVTLGTKTVTCENANAVKPFGAIDTPAPGGEASGSSYIVHGWVLTPPPNTIPITGNTINVYVDSIYLGHPVYNIYRSDVASLFPGYANSNGAGGYFDIDTTAFSNGVHTIHWISTDNAGNSDGIGSRYFTIQNSGVSGQRSVVSGQGSGIRNQWSVVSEKPVGVIKGYKRNVKSLKNYPDKKGDITIEIKELERIEIHLADDLAEIKVTGDSSDNSKFKIQNSKFYSGYMVVGNRSRTLPIGSTFDTGKGIFYWLPGPGFIGKYRLVFVTSTGTRTYTKRNITIKIGPKFLSPSHRRACWKNSTRPPIHFFIVSS